MASSLLFNSEACENVDCLVCRTQHHSLFESESDFSAAREPLPRRALPAVSLRESFGGFESQERKSSLQPVSPPRVACLELPDSDIEMEDEGRSDDDNEHDDEEEQDDGEDFEVSMMKLRGLVYESSQRGQHKWEEARVQQVVDLARLGAKWAQLQEEQRLQRRQQADRQLVYLLETRSPATQKDSLFDMADTAERRRTGDALSREIEEQLAMSRNAVAEMKGTLVSKQRAEAEKELQELQKAKDAALAKLKQQQDELRAKMELLAKEKAKEEELRKQQQQKQQQQQQQAAVPPQVNNVSANAPPSASGKPLEDVDAALWLDCENMMKNFPKERAGALFKLKMPITKALNTVTPEPKTVIMKAKDIVAVLQEAKKLSEDLLRLMEFHFANQLCGMVLSKMNTKVSNVFPYAAVAAYVCAHSDGCWKLLAAGLRQRCKYLRPGYVADRLNGESVVAYKKRLGCIDDSVFIREQNGFCTFFSAICCAQVSGSGTMRSAMPRLGELWTVLSSLLNERPSFMVADLITSILETAGPELLAVYGKQFRKILFYIHSVFVKMCRTSPRDSIVDEPLVSRLEDLLKKCAVVQFSRMPDVDEQLYPEYNAVKRTFQMRKI